MIQEEDPENTGLTNDEIYNLINPQLFDSHKPFAFPETSIDSTYVEPISGGMQYRGWYGQSNGKSNWKPQSSRWEGRNGKHKGLDLFCHSLTPLRALTTGNAEYNDTRNPKGWGNFIMLYFNMNGVKYIAVYSHLDAVSKFEGVKKFEVGSQIGTSGCSGNAGVNGNCHRGFRCSSFLCIEDHLHLEILELKEGGVEKINPLTIFDWNIKFEDDDTNELCSEANLQYQTLSIPA